MSPSATTPSSTRRLPASGASDAPGEGTAPNNLATSAGSTATGALTSAGGATDSGGAASLSPQKMTLAAASTHTQVVPRAAGQRGDASSRADMGPDYHSERVPLHAASPFTSLRPPHIQVMKRFAIRSRQHLQRAFTLIELMVV